MAEHIQILSGYKDVPLGLHKWTLRGHWSSVPWWSRHGEWLTGQDWFPSGVSRWRKFIHRESCAVLNMLRGHGIVHCNGSTLLSSVSVKLPRSTADSRVLKSVSTASGLMSISLCAHMSCVSIQRARCFQVWPSAPILSAGWGSFCSQVLIKNLCQIWRHNKTVKVSSDKILIGEKSHKCLWIWISSTKHQELGIKWCFLKHNAYPLVISSLFL